MAPDAWKVYALRHGTSDRFPLAGLVHGAVEHETHPIGWYFWLLTRPGHVVLVDCGFADPALTARWDIRGHADAVDLLARLDVAPGDVADLVLTHGHWDHAGGLGLFPAARLWIRERELRWMEQAVRDGDPMRLGVSPEDLRILHRAGGRLRLLGDETTEALPGVVLVPGGAHTPGSQWVRVETGRGTVVLASDAAYLFRNVEEPVPVGACASAEDNLRTLRAMRAAVAPSGLVVPGHEPAVAERFPEVAAGVFAVTSSRTAGGAARE